MTEVATKWARLLNGRQRSSAEAKAERAEIEAGMKEAEQPKRVQVNFRAPAGWKETKARRARRLDMTLTDLILVAVDEYLAKHGGEQ